MTVLKQNTKLFISYIVFSVLLFAVSILVLEAQTNKEVYQEKLTQLKSDDADGHYKLGLWCEQNELPEQATAQFEKVLTLQPEHKAARTKLGFIKYKDKWIKSNEKDKVDYEEKEFEVNEDNAKEQYELGLWCKSKKMWKEALLHLTKAAELVPNDKNITRAIEEVKALIKKGEAAPNIANMPTISFKLKVGVGFDETEAKMQRYAGAIKEFSQLLAKYTGGVIYIKEASFTDMCIDATYPFRGKKGTYDVIIHPSCPGCADMALGIIYLQPDSNESENQKSGGFSMSSSGSVNVTGMNFLHEFGHSHLGLKDEYDMNKRTADNTHYTDLCSCIMASGSRDSGFCNGARHPKKVPNSPGCQELLINKFKNKCPSLGAAFKKKSAEIKYPPETVVTINNDGK